jgi:2-polyprenyl-3-methyl-5-hydroxy-6-metoxy-1,4-benzoquinol methylase
MNSGLRPRKGRVPPPAVAHREALDVIDPELYARWRESYLGALTERIEEDAIFRLAGDLGGKRVLDLGCGDGTYSVAAFQRGAHVTGVDISNAMLDSAQRRASACGASVEWRQASAESLPYDSGKFDIVLAVTILCFVKNPLQAVQEVSRVLRPGRVVCHRRTRQIQRVGAVAQGARVVWLLYVERHPLLDSRRTATVVTAGWVPGYRESRVRVLPALRSRGARRG